MPNRFSSEEDKVTRIHIALSVADVQHSIEDYSRRLGCSPSAVVPGEYALWRTDCVNLSIRRTSESGGRLRHLGWEDPTASTFTQETDANGIIWESFTAELQVKEIKDVWPHAKFSEGGDK